MTEEVRVVCADPAGNITILVLDEINQGDRVTVANRLLGYPKWKAEQVGFVVPAVRGGAGRLEMMGGEFCGNAARSFGYYLATQREMSEGTLAVEISGTQKLLSVSADTVRHTAWTQMPIPHGVEQIRILDAEVFPMVRMDGILHVILEHRQPEERLTRFILEAVRRTYHPEALGVLYVNGSDMKPVVYVAATDTLVHENSCGSGSIAYAYYLAGRQLTGTCREAIRQPGGIIETTLVKEAGKVKVCKMGGRIELSAPVTVRL